MKPDKDVLELLRKAKGDNEGLTPIATAPMDKAELEKPTEVSENDPLLKYVLNQWDIAASEVEEKANVTIRKEP
ncbi:MAG: hypothetical protein IKO35_02895 [Elusimicrobiaceae bacterium]|nr:hypothetical protein [Elusimicrobiaceae bacterium]